MRTLPFEPFGDDDVLRARFRVNGDGSVDHAVETRPRRGWTWYGRDQRPRSQGEPGLRLIGWALGLLFALGLGLLSVSVAAQYRYVLAQRHQVTASLVEAASLDVGLCIISLLALGLARKGLSSNVERALIVTVALASAVMNYAAASGGNWRSVLAFTMPPVFLAVVVDRTVSVIRRHVLGMQEGRSAWAGTGRVGLYGLRLLLALPSTCGGLRRWVLEATPLPAAEAATRPAVMLASAPPAIEAPGPAVAQRKAPARRAGRTTKTARFLDLVRERHGDYASIPEDRVSPISRELAPAVGLDTGAARTALRARVLQALEGGELR